MSLHRSQWSAELPVLTWDSPDDTSSLTRCRSMSSDLHCPSLGSNSLFKGKTVSATQSSFADFLAPTNNLRGPATAGSNGSNNDAARLSPGRAKNASSPLDNSSLIDRQIEEDIGNLLSEMKGMSRGVDALLSKMNTRKTMCHRRRMSRSLPDLSVLKSPEKRPNHTAAASRDRKSEAANKRAVGSARTRRPAHGKSSSKSKAGSVPCPGYGCTSLAGSHHAHLGKKKQNQDSFLVHRDFPTKGALVFAIFDGHGRKGKSVSKFCADNFVSCLQKCNFHKTKANRHAAISKAFQMLHRQLHNTNFDTVESGSTAVACILLPAEQKAVVINCGDSRVCVGSVMPSGVSEPPKSKTPKGVRLTPGQFALDGGKPTSHSRTSSTPSTLKPLFHIKFLLRAHKPTEPKERRRIEAAGGVVYCMEGDCDRVWGGDPTDEYSTANSGIAMSRSLGDEDLHRFGVTVEPDVREVSISSSDDFLILGSDGVFDQVNEFDIVALAEHARERDDSDHGQKWNAESFSEELCRMAWRRWKAKGSRIDDVTAIAVNLRHCMVPFATTATRTESSKQARKVQVTKL